MHKASVFNISTLTINNPYYICITFDWGFAYYIKTYVGRREARNFFWAFLQLVLFLFFKDNISSQAFFFGHKNNCLNVTKTSKANFPIPTGRKVESL